MKILLDECLNWRLRREFESHEVSTVQELGWSGTVNGELMRLASETGFEVFITIDKNLKFQQNIKKYQLVVVVPQARLNRLEYHRPLIPIVLRKLPMMKMLCYNCRAKFILLINAVKILLFRNKRDESRFTINIFTQPLKPGETYEIG